MKHMAASLIILSAFLFGCYDIFSENEKNLIGNISVINPNNQEDNAFKLVFHESEFNSNIIEDYVIEASGNESVLLIRGVTKNTCSWVFYKVLHKKGKQILSTQKIDETSYNSSIKTLEKSIHFITDIPKCD